MSRIITPSEAAQQLDVTEEDLSFWRDRGLGPRWIKLGKTTVRYVDTAVYEWVIGQLSDAAPVLTVEASDELELDLQKETLPDVD
ncbi:hypothetical protein [Nesterenkonia sp.]|uniref:helix-turn-helix transcriptional regulator n=1 Tax=Nesterenkonia sp. TaxID=704201 RepID=UPI00262C543C|nr:hypothetical protein [Nesterenkonia sp.]